MRKINYTQQPAVFWALASFNVVMYLIVIPLRCI